MTEKAGKSTNHWPLLDFLRATAALLVLFAHTRSDWYFLDIGAVARPGLFLKLFYFTTNLGHETVVIFLVLSGFLMGKSLLDSMQRGSFDLVRYLVARFIRIYIAYIPALVITEAVFLVGSILLSDPGAGHVPPLFDQRQMDFGGLSQAICHLAGLEGFSCLVWQQNPSLWSLGYEWALYLFAPAIIQVIVGKVSLSLRLLAIALVCAIAATVCQYPSKGVFWFSAWFLGAASYRVLGAGLVPLPAGLLGAGLIIAGMAISRLEVASQLKTDTIIAAGTAIAIACRPMVAFSLAPRLFGWAAGFSCTLYAIHASLLYLAVAIFQNIGFSTGRRSAESGGLYGIWDHNRDLPFGRLSHLARFRAKNRASPCRHDENVSAPHGSKGER